MSAAGAIFLEPLDALRASFLRAFGAPLPPLLVDREKRVALTACAVVLGALALAWSIPHILLVASPLVVGVPHLVADLRYLVLRPGLHRRPILWATVGLPLLLLLLPGAGIWPGLLAAGGALAISRGSARRRFWGFTALAVACLGTWALGKTAGPVMAHVHHLVALGFWWAWKSRQGRLHLVPLALVVVGAVFLLLVPPLAAPGDACAGLTFRRLSVSLGAWGEVGLRLAALFAFTQAVHYATWLRLIPEEDRDRPVPRSFRSSLVALCRDFGTWPLVLCLALAFGVTAWGLTDAVAARAGYFRLSLFHGHLELAALALLWTEGRFLRLRT